VNKPVLLVVDDDSAVLGAVRRDLRTKYGKDYSVVSAPSGEEALAAIKELKARGDALAVVISDQRMPGMHGTELLAKSLDVYPQAKRVLLTAYSDIDAAIKAINVAHLDHYLSKPWDPPEEFLFPVIDDLVDSWQAEHQPEEKGLRLVGHQWSPRSHQIKDFLARNLIPYRWLDLGFSPDARKLLEAASVDDRALPALFFEDGTVLCDPEPRQVTERLGRALTASHDLYDIVIAGAGPAGLAAAVCASSEGLRTLLVDRHAPGGQAGSSSRIENYLGFPAGVSGSELTRRAVAQASRLGAELVVPLEVKALAIQEGYKLLTLGDGRELVSQTLLIATGMDYREHPAEGMKQYAGSGVYYGAATTEASAFRDRRVLVVGGGNSAGQAAMHLARYAKEVHIIVRRDSLADTMSRYLIDQIKKTPNISVRGRTELERCEGDDCVRCAVLKTGDDAGRKEDFDAVFVFIGTRPRTDWLPEPVLRDDKGFVLTSREVVVDPRFPRVWKERRQPLPLETSVPGVFAAGDVRAKAMNRVAAAVGEGAIAVRFVHEYLTLQ
jgi:thioredoxin reductase (NADPH)